MNIIFAVAHDALEFLGLGRLTEAFVNACIDRGQLRARRHMREKADQVAVYKFLCQIEDVKLTTESYSFRDESDSLYKFRLTFKTDCPLPVEGEVALAGKTIADMLSIVAKSDPYADFVRTAESGQGPTARFYKDHNVKKEHSYVMEIEGHTGNAYVLGRNGSITVDVDLGLQGLDEQIEGVGGKEPVYVSDHVRMLLQFFDSLRKEAVVYRELSQKASPQGPTPAAA